ncbi:MAG: hypothetical protein JWQ92_2309, partial [Amnibacterium sp.]|nr:hypothetical protein [Amnibacterium sp.]
LRGGGAGDGGGAGAPVDPQRIAATFDVRPEAARLLAGGEDWSVLRLETEPNTAVGHAAWGPFAAVAADPDAPAARGFASWPVLQVAPTDVLTHDGGRRRFLVVGRDNHRHPASRAVIDALRKDGCDVVAVDLGWPSEDRRYADVATFGSSRAVGAALLELLTAGR